MNKFRFTINVLAIAIFTFAFASMAQAQATRTWVSGVGDDANPCSRTAPCKTFAGAISKTATGGEINALDSAGFGALTIGKSITVEGGGNIAGVLTSLNASGIIINAPTDAVVALRNLDFDGLGTAGNGIRILQAKLVVVDHCQIFGFRGSPGRGISDERNTITPIPQLYVNDCYIRDNNGGVAAFSAGSNGPIRVTIDNTRIQSNTATGVFGQNSAVIMVRFCNISGNLGDGVQVNTGAQANVISSVLTENQGIAANNVSGTQLSLADTSIINNITGVSGTITSFGNNNVRNNQGGNALPAPVGQQ
jgi:hypothetical protein